MQAQLNYNFRGITITDGIHSANKSLCDRCFHPVCSDYSTLSCQDFTPALKFKALIGFDNERFNTFRIGAAWSKRLKPDSLVAIVNAKTDELFAHCRVTEVYCGNKVQMADLHGYFNHSMLALNITDNIAFHMLKRLKNSSGSMIYNSSDTVSVIYLEKIK